MTYQAPITGLHSPTLLPFLQNSTDYFMMAQSCQFKVNCCFICLTCPTACTRVRVPLTFGHVHKPSPLNPMYPKRVPFNRYWAETCLHIRGNAPVKLWRGVPKIWNPVKIPRHPPPRIRLIYIPINSLLNSGFQIRSISSIDPWVPKVVLSGASLLTLNFCGGWPLLITLVSCDCCVWIWPSSSLPSQTWITAWG